MKYLLIFDGRIDVKNLNLGVEAAGQDSLSVFPLTSEWKVIRDVENACSFDGPVNTETLESARLIDKEVDGLRQRIFRWSADFGGYKVSGRPVKEWFLLPEKEISTWWFSQLSEKNPFMTDAFFRVAQANAMDKAISSGSFDSCIFSVSEPDLAACVKRICARHKIAFRRLPSLYSGRISIKRCAKSLLSQNRRAYSILEGFYFFGMCVFRATRTALTVGFARAKGEKALGSVLLVSYFPSLDMEAAKEGVIKNRYMLGLQEKMGLMKKNIIWLWMYVRLHGASYGDAMKLAKGFKRSGKKNFLIDEFMTPAVLFRVLYLWLRQVVAFFKVKRYLPEKIFYEDISVPEGGVFLNNAMTKSFLGREGLEGILDLELYKKVFSIFPDVSHCIYFMEMHAWEKAMNAAKMFVSPCIKTVGFQHGGISPNHFFYFQDPDEISRDKGPTSMPLPDILACNGDVPLELMGQSGYPNMRKLEAVRHLYMSERHKDAAMGRCMKEDALLIAGSVSGRETRAVISLFREAFPDTSGMKVWLKSHPAMPFEQVLRGMGLEARECGYVIKNDPVEKLLEKARILLVVNSTVAIEALAAGCSVIAPVFSDSMDMNNLKGFEQFYTKIYGPAELRQAVRDTLSDKQGKDPKETEDFISRYWCLDRSLKRWEEVLT